MQIVVLDGHTLNPGDLSWDGIKVLADQFVYYPRTSSAEVYNRSMEADILVTNKVVLDRDLIGRLPGLKYIAVTATGYNNVDIEAATARNIPVSHVPEYATPEVAQHTFALILALCNQVAAHDKSVRDGAWTRSGDFSFTRTNLVALAGNTIGIIGYGRIGAKVGAIAKAFGMREIRVGSHNRENLRALLEASDIVTLHCPLTPATREMINANTLGYMKKTAFLINTARGELVDEKALANCLQEGGIAGAAVDVVTEEPIRSDNSLLQAPNCIITPHMAWATHRSRKRLMEIVTENIRSFLKGDPQNCILH